MSHTITRAAYARQKDVHPAQVGRWIRAGLPLAKNGGINPRMADEWLRRNIDPWQRIRIHSERAYAEQRQAVPPPPREMTEVDRGLAIMVTWLAGNLPRRAAGVAQDRGLDPSVIFELVAEAAAAEAAEILESVSIPAPPGIGSWPEWALEGFTPAPMEGARPEVG
jgi:hypothetical protein